MNLDFLDDRIPPLSIAMQDSAAPVAPHCGDGIAILTAALAFFIVCAMRRNPASAKDERQSIKDISEAFRAALDFYYSGLIAERSARN